MLMNDLMLSYHALLDHIELYMNEIMNKGFTDLNWWKLKSVIYPSLFAYFSVLPTARDQSHRHR